MFCTYLRRKICSSNFIHLYFLSSLIYVP